MVLKSAHTTPMLYSTCLPKFLTMALWHLLQLLCLCYLLPPALNPPRVMAMSQVTCCLCNSSKLLVSSAVLIATALELVYSYTLACSCQPYLPGCLHVLQPNWPLYCILLKSMPLAGRPGTTDWILHIDGTCTSSPFT